jgi:hypothetical protein
LNLLTHSVFELFDFAGCIFVRFPFNWPQRKESAGVRSGDLCGQGFFEIILSLKIFQFLACSHLKCDMLHRLVGNTQ